MCCRARPARVVSEISVAADPARAPATPRPRPAPSKPNSCDILLDPTPKDMTMTLTRRQALLACRGNPLSPQGLPSPRRGPCPSRSTGPRTPTTSACSSRAGQGFYAEAGLDVEHPALQRHRRRHAGRQPCRRFRHSRAPWPVHPAQRRRRPGRDLCDRADRNRPPRLQCRPRTTSSGRGTSTERSMAASAAPGKRR